MTPKFSPSAIKTFQLCERRWYFAKVLGLTEPENPRAESGKGMHWLLKDWYRNGAPPSVRRPPPGEGKVGPNEVDMAIESLPALPMRSPHLIAEEHLQFSFGGVDYHGYADLRWSTRAYDVVHDHKSTSSLVWALTAEDLVWDPQRIVYGYSTGRDTLARWQYVETGKTKGEHATMLVEVFGTRPQMIDAMTWLHESYGLRMAAALHEPEEARPQNPAACGKYGKEGCPYKYRCQIAPQQRMRSIMSLAALKAKMDAKRVEMNVESPKPPAAEPVAPVKPIDTRPEPTFSDDSGMMAVAAQGATAAEQQGMQTQAAAKPADPRPSEQKAPKATRKPRADKGKPRGGEAAPAVNVAPEIDAELLLLRKQELDGRILPLDQQALLDVIAALGTLDGNRRTAVLNAALAFFGGAS